MTTLGGVPGLIGDRECSLEQEDTPKQLLHAGLGSEQSVCTDSRRQHGVELITLLTCRDAVSPEVAPSLPLQAKANPKLDNYVDDAHSVTYV